MTKMYVSASLGKHYGDPLPDSVEVTGVTLNDFYASPEQIIASLTAAVQSHLDAAARAKGYDGILSAASYAGDSHPPFNSEGVAFRDWRGAVWATCYSIMADVQGGLRPVPDAATLISELPVLVLA